MSPEKIWTVVMQRLDGGETQDIQGAPDFIACFADAEAGFRGNESREFLASRLQEQPGLCRGSRGERSV
jgi:hypothetical protein